jgi:hypothetical protein
MIKDSLTWDKTLLFTHIFCALLAAYQSQIGSDPNGVTAQSEGQGHAHPCPRPWMSGRIHPSDPERVAEAALTLSGSIGS